MTLDSQTTWPRAWLRVGNVTIVSFLLLLVFFAVRAHLLGDGRGGWAMYSHNVQFVVTYEWEFADGRQEPYFPGDEIQGRADHLRMRPVESGEITPNNSRYGLWTLKSWIENYVDYLYKHKRPKGAVAVIATLRYSVNEPLAIGDEIPYQDPVFGVRTFLPTNLETNQTVTVIRRGERTAK